METQPNRLLQIARDLYPEYDQIEPLGHGGMGDIFKGRKTNLNVPVIIKIIKSKFKGRLNERQEAEILKGLKHKYLPRVYDVIENRSGYLYTIMDYIPGENLKDYVRRVGVVDQKTAYRWVTQLCDVVSYLHEQTPSIIHSDIKPSNLMITPDGNICLIDFNTSLELHAGLTAIGKTRGYAAPEQYTKPEQVVQQMQQAAGLKSTDENDTILVSGSSVTGDETILTREVTSTGSVTNPPSTGSSEALFSRFFRSSAFSTASTGGTRSNYYGTVTKQTDVYAIGATVYFALTGMDPPHALEPSVPLSTFKLPISRSMVQIVERAMQKNAQDRFSDAAEMGRALQNIHQLDRKYRSIHLLTVVGIALEAVLLLGGIALIFAGTNRIRVEQNAAYFDLLYDVQAKKNAGHYEEAVERAKEAQSLLDTKMEAYAEEAAVYYSQGAASTDIEQRKVYFKKCVTTVQTLLESDLSGGTSQEWSKIFFIGAESCVELEAYKEDKQDYSQARKWYRSAISYLPEENTYRGYIYACALDNDLEEAKLALEEAKSIFPAASFDSSALLIQAELCYFSGDISGAIENYQQLLEKTPDTDFNLPRLYLTANYACVHGGNQFAAVRVEILEKACERLPSSWYVFKPLLANAYSVQAEQNVTNEETKNEWLQKALDAYDTVGFGILSIEDQLKYAWILKNLGRIDDSEAALMEMTELHSNDFRVYMRLSFLYLEKWTDALEKRNSGNHSIPRKEIDEIYQLSEEMYLKAKELYEQINTKNPEMEQLKNYWDSFYSATAETREKD